MSVCKRVFSVGFGPGLNSLSPARSWRSAGHAAGSHDWLPRKTSYQVQRAYQLRYGSYIYFSVNLKFFHIL